MTIGRLIATGTKNTKTICKPARVARLRFVIKPESAAALASDLPDLSVVRRGMRIGRYGDIGDTKAESEALRPRWQRRTPCGRPFTGLHGMAHACFIAKLRPSVKLAEYRINTRSIHHPFDDWSQRSPSRLSLQATTIAMERLPKGAQDRVGRDTN
ncbi:hypothetical protein BHE74_00011822 [Ensete ventricosum]|uniref:Uncharacterized protein n=1 Tax=Ensete ventricosum TaxID=4639 RepID=A0A426Z4F9_ENSVE|nr:hypothetical protein B296_00004746 [Ensete ventricosum]RWW79870.1 hypothetical protein BHE74_00011822 [Ensete ventricosum]RZR83583.1 hypothetical protein BHM03_00010205 [Ensete ventricosum]